MLKAWEKEKGRSFVRNRSLNRSGKVGRPSKRGKTLAMFDCETDPFTYDNDDFPRPFVVGLYFDKKFIHFWGDDCITQFVNFLEDTAHEFELFAHNGGKFDFLFLTDYLSGKLQVVGSRILKANLGRHTLIDSYGIMPFPLSAYKKDDFDYSKMERPVRETHKTEILHYLKNDCVYLMDLVSTYRELFGNKLTVGGTAMAQIKKRHEFSHLGVARDADMRQFFFGGRVSTFRSGKLKGNWKVFDVNSMYPFVMKTFKFGCGIPGNKDSVYFDLTKRGDGTAFEPDDLFNGSLPYDFAVIDATSYAALPIRIKNRAGISSLQFPIGRHEFYASSFEIKAAQELGLLRVHSVSRMIGWTTKICFDTFVDDFYAYRMDAKAKGDDLRTLLFKYVLNSGYGKFAQNPDDFKEFQVLPTESEPDDSAWQIVASGPTANIWAKPAEAGSGTRYNVGIAAGITGAARAWLLRAIAVAKNPAYCDTDSIICEDLPIVADDKKLGAWKLEATGDTLSIAGKKMYALTKDGETVKSASKGARLDYLQIDSVSSGNTVDYRALAVRKSLSGAVTRLNRRVRNTAETSPPPQKDALCNQFSLV